jgi:hypothetical protein
MKNVFSTTRRVMTLALIVLAATLQPQARAQAATTAAPVALNREQAAAILPATVFYRGQSAPVQGRNSAGIKMPDGKLVLFAMVDTSGYSSAIQQTYQAYLISEVPLKIGEQSLAPGAYGFGFVAGDKMVVLDLGANELMHTATARDAALARPTPLQLLPDPAAAGHFRLYLGRSYVSLIPAVK